MAPSPPASGQSKLYRAIMTPIIFVSFLFSLAWVEFRYSMLRSHSHDKPPPSYKSSSSKGSPNDASNTAGDGSEPSSACSHRRMPGWLHSIVYRRQPYHYVLIKGDAQHAGAKTTTTTAASTRSANNGTYYHSMQRKLLKMESDEAFRIRTTVLCVMGVAVVGIVWASMVAIRWVASCLWV
ncbi:hypothetical protein SCUCBS95973_004017 [Sporothrix curviconia]|uniref:Uncharacterized protein n=1 Tax=Sporothrix curviconia TaxID=1260050 RepID=A0ABP0BLR7_9PEZI